MRVAKYHWHPLAFLFFARHYNIDEGLNWLQERGYISDECVTVDDVAPCDVRRVLKLANAEIYLR